MMKLAERNDGKLLFEAVGHLRKAIYLIDSDDSEEFQKNWNLYYQAVDKMARELNVPRQHAEGFIRRMERRV